VDGVYWAVSGYLYPSLSMAIPVITRCFLWFVNSSVKANLRSFYADRIIQALTHQLEHYLGDLESQLIASMATVLDPRFDSRDFRSLSAYETAFARIIEQLEVIRSLV